MHSPDIHDQSLNPIDRWCVLLYDLIPCMRSVVFFTAHTVQAVLAVVVIRVSQSSSNMTADGVSRI